MSEITNEPRAKVNGKFLPQFNGKPVSMLGQVLKVHASGSTFDMKSTDNKVITVVFNEPLMDNLEGWVEVRGKGQGQSSIIGNHIVSLNNVIDDSFDYNLYDEVVSVINSCNNPWSSSNKN